MKWSSALVTKMRESDIPQFRVKVFWVFSIRVLPHTSYSDIGYFMDKVMDCLGALGFESCYG